MKHRILLLGLGFWGSRWLDLICSSPRAELCGICGTDSELSDARDKYGLPNSILYTSYIEAIAMTNADIAVVVLPGSLHFDADRLALEKGMSVITEKPLAMSMEEAQALLNIKASRPELKFMTCQNYRWRPHNQTIKKAIMDGMIGELETILVEFRRQEDLQGYRAGLEQPLLQDVAIHHFDLIRFFTGLNCRSIFCTSYRPSWSLFSGRPSTDALIELEAGARVVYNGSWAARGRESSWNGNFTITGSKGCLTLDADNQVKFFEHKADKSVVLNVVSQKGILLSPQQMPFEEMAYGLNHFLDCMEEDAVPETTLEDNIHSFAMVSAGLKSVDTGATVNC